MSSHSFFFPSWRSQIKRQNFLVLLSFTLLSCPTFGDDSKLQSGGLHSRFEVQDYGSIDDATSVLASALWLNETQRTQLINLMEQRAKKLVTLRTSVEQIFREKVESLLNVSQQRKVDWLHDDRWTTLSRWTAVIDDLSLEQITELDRLIQQRNSAIWAALLSTQKGFTEGLQLVLTEEQRKILAKIEAKEPIVRIPMMRK